MSEAGINQQPARLHEVWELWVTQQGWSEDLEWARELEALHCCLLHQGLRWGQMDARVGTCWALSPS